MIGTCADVILGVACRLGLRRRIHVAATSPIQTDQLSACSGMLSTSSSAAWLTAPWIASEIVLAGKVM